MAFTVEQLHAKASGSAKALSTMTAKQRETTVSDVIASDFNNLRSLVLAARPELEGLLPAALTKTPGSYGVESHSENYQDVQAFYSQISAILLADS